MATKTEESGISFSHPEGTQQARGPPHDDHAPETMIKGKSRKLLILYFGYMFTFYPKF